MNKHILTGTLLALALALPGLASAESTLATGSGTITANARLDFKIIIPKVLFLGVGSGASATPLATLGTVDLVTFDYSSAAAAVGSGSGGTATGNAVPVRVVGNNGTITLSATTSGAINNGGTTPDTIPWSEITASSSDATNLPSPTIPATGLGSAVNVVANSGKVTNRTATWTYGYANSAVIAPGTYGGAGGVNNGRVTYTATML